MRKPGHDYRFGWYFVTICTMDRENMFGAIYGDSMQLNAIGIIVNFRWQWMQWFYSSVILDEWVVMPNHIHGILFLSGKGDAPFAKLDKPKPLGNIIGAFKTTSKMIINTIPGFGRGISIWQDNFHDRIIRNHKDLETYRNYIRKNPKRWKHDSKNDSPL